ncbi:acyl-CoA carboxylase biotin carboxyl carrier protein subunit, partial [Rhodovulum sulfidophilum]|uniref:acetyl-CoA carboxylase biotin carboxyl carrier protein subunit n=1 Tax=Rhodovulum sulfidophilum TaxID=35806 RepID=UPI001F2537EC
LFTLWAPLRRRVTLRRDGEEVMGTLLFEGPARATVEIGQTVLDARLAPEGWRIEGALPGAVLRAGGAIHVFAGADGSFSFTPVDPLDRAAAAGAGADVIEAPMPGLLKTLAVSEGEHVAMGQPLAVLEAMKMEHMLAAPRAGIVAEVLAAPGAQVEAGAALIRLTPEEEDA